MRRLLLSGAFQREAKRLADKSILTPEALTGTLRQLESDPFQPRLKTRRLRGEFEGFWACTAGYDLRIVFRFVQHEGEEAVLLAAIGTHDEVY